MIDDPWGFEDTTDWLDYTDDDDYDLVTLEDEDYEYGPITYGEDL